MKSDNDLLSYLKTKDQAYFELEMSCLVIESFLLMIKNKNYASILDMEFIQEMFLFNQSMHEQLKFIFFIMAPHAVLKQEPIFKTLYNYLFKKNINELYMFLKNR